MRIIGQPQPKVICSDAGAGGYQAFPDVCLMDNGELLCVFYAGYSHVSHPTPELPQGARVMGIRSSDLGETWSDAFLIADTPWDDRDPSITQLPDGRLLCNFFTYYKDAEYRTSPANGYKEIWLTESLDHGRTWSPPWTVKSLLGDTWGCTAPLLVLPDSTLMMPVYREHGIEDIRTAVITSTDAGKTWSPPTWVDPWHGDCDEADLVMLPGDRIYCAMRANYAKTMWWSESLDLGKTWSLARPMGFPGHAPYLLLTSSQVLLVAHRLPNTSMHYSLDYGRTWGSNIQLDEHHGAYPSMVELPDGRVLIVYYEEGEGSAIRQQIFRITPDTLEFLPAE